MRESRNQSYFYRVGSMTHRANFWTGLVVTSFALFALLWIIPTQAGESLMAGMPPDLLPRLAMYLTLISGAIVTIDALRKMLREGTAPITLNLDWPMIGWSLWPIGFVGLIVFLLSMFKMTYAGPVILAVFLVLLGERRWYVLLPCSTVPVLLLYGLSVYLMRVGVV